MYTYPGHLNHKVDTLSYLEMALIWKTKNNKDNAVQNALRLKRSLNK